MKRVRPIGLIGLLALPFLVGALLIWGPTACAPHSKLLKMTMIDVGQGDSILLETPSGRTVLIDGGIATREEHGELGHDSGASIVVPYLRHEGVHRVDIVVVTHAHADHVGGLATVLRTFPVGLVLDGDVLPYPDPIYDELLKAERERHVPVQAARQGQKIAFGDGVTLECLNPPVTGTPYGTEPTNDAMNNYSAVYRLTYGSVHIMLDGDAQADAEQRMLAVFGPNGVRADVLKCGHHGSDNASSAEWLDAVHPSLALISCGAHNHYGHPGHETLGRLAARNIRTYITARVGAVTVTTDGRTVNAISEKSAN